MLEIGDFVHLHPIAATNSTLLSPADFLSPLKVNWRKRVLCVQSRLISPTQTESSSSADLRLRADKFPFGEHVWTLVNLVAQVTVACHERANMMSPATMMELR